MSGGLRPEALRPYFSIGLPLSAYFAIYINLCDFLVKYGDLLILFLAVMIICAAVGMSIYSFGRSAKPQKSDCIIILGCQVYGSEPSPFLKSRLDEGLRLFNEGYAGHIIVSGGKGPGEDISEAGAMKNYLEKKGVDPSVIIIEDKSRSTYENIKNSKEKMQQYKFDSGIIVSNKYHLKRASLIAEKEGIQGSIREFL
jgi:uncharacterized SAM-binding protein YcdF (DUF218 family)